MTSKIVPKLLFGAVVCIEMERHLASVVRKAFWKSNSRVGFFCEYLLHTLHLVTRKLHTHLSFLQERPKIAMVCFIILLCHRQMKADDEVRKLGEIQPSSIFPAIIGGSPVSPPDKYPWIVYVSCVFEDTTELLCPGTLISNEHILSAGQCNPIMFYQCSLSQIMVIFR